MNNETETYIYNQKDWPVFHWKTDELASQISKFTQRRDDLKNKIAGLGIKSESDIELDARVRDMVGTSEIEGEHLSHSDALNAVVRRLGSGSAGLSSAERSVEGLVAMTMDATRRHDEPLTKERLYRWHRGMFPTGRSDMQKIRVGAWRDDAHQRMSITSEMQENNQFRRVVHYVAPQAVDVDRQMDKFLDWFNREDETDPLIKSGLAHLWFVAIHPFEDGNGRIARAIADMKLSQAEHSSNRFYSLSTQIHRERATYFDIMEGTLKGDMDVTPFLRWYVRCLNRAILRSDQIVAGAVCTCDQRDDKKERYTLKQRLSRERRGLASDVKQTARPHRPKDRSQENTTDAHRQRSRLQK